MRQKKQARTIKINICENIKRVQYDYKFGDKFMINDKDVYKYNTPYHVPFD